MISIAQYKRGVDVLEVFGCEGFDGCLCANGREDRREEIAVRCGEDPRAGAIVFSCDGEGEHARIISDSRYSIFVIRSYLKDTMSPSPKKHTALAYGASVMRIAAYAIAFCNAFTLSATLLFPPNMALPATRTVAPACTASAALLALMPPSTSSHAFE